MGAMRRVVLQVSAVALVVFLAGLLQLARLEHGGPVHADLVLPGEIPATVFLPAAGGRAAARAHFLAPPPPDARPPAVVVMHGFAGDRASMSGLCRRLAASGYGVLCFDAMGHGANRNPFHRGEAVADAFAAEFGAAVDFLRSWPFVDGERIAVLGYSMGARAALDYASRDSGIDAAVLISGGTRMEGPYPPANALFLYASGDPERIRERAAAAAAQLAGVDTLAAGTTHGDPSLRNARRRPPECRVDGEDPGRDVDVARRGLRSRSGAQRHPGRSALRRFAAVGVGISGPVAWPGPAGGRVGSAGPTASQ
jgi:dienelactone hydrolase